jgi:hypothetical protein
MSGRKREGSGVSIAWRFWSPRAYGHAESEMALEVRDFGPQRPAQPMARVPRSMPFASFSPSTDAKGGKLYGVDA